MTEGRWTATRFSKHTDPLALTDLPVYTSYPSVSESDSFSNADTLSSETDVDSAGSLVDFVNDGCSSDFLPASETASAEWTPAERRLQISDALDSAIGELIRLRDLLDEHEADAPGRSGTKYIGSAREGTLI